MESLLQDIRFAFRMLRKSPGFTAVAVLSLTLGIGANTTIFTLAKAIFLQSVPAKDPSRIVTLYSTAQTRGGLQQYLGTPYPNAVDYREKTNCFSGLTIALPTGVNMTISGHPQQLFAEVVNANIFDVLGVTPLIGRSFSPDEDTSPRPVAIISYALWNRQFGRDPGILGKTLQLNQQEFSVIGVTPKELVVVGSLGNPDIWLPMSMHEQILTGILKDSFNQRSFRLTNAIARLKPGVTLAQASQEVHALGLQLEKAYPKDNAGRNEELVPINETLIPPQLHSVFALAAALMMGIVGLVLLVACANVANLLLARATQRQREIAVRMALGGSRNRIVRQLLTESLLMALLAGVLGVFCAYWGRSLVLSLLPQGVPLPPLDFSLDGRVLFFTMALAIVATVVFGLVPALQASKRDSVASLKDRTGAQSGSTRWYGLRGVLVMIQVALSLVALAGAGLFIHSLRNAQKINPGFEVQHELTMFVNLGAQNYSQPQAEAFYRDVVDRLDTIPVVAGASFADTAPLSGGLQRTTFTDGVDSSDPRNGKLTPVISTAPGYFSTAGITMIAGRDFAASDDDKGNFVGIVNRAAAEGFWPSQDPIGKRLHFLGESWVVTVIGEVNNVKYLTLGEPPQPIVYMPLKQHYAAAAVLYVHAKGDPAKALPSVRSTIQSLAPDVPLLNVQTGDQLLLASLTAPRMAAELLGGFGILALVLAAIGTYGVMSYSVNQRGQEIGIRMALGAQPANVMRLILGNGMAMVTVGILMGLVFSTFLAKGMTSLLYGIAMFDAASFLSTAALLILVALGACFLPARRAMKVDPMVALRYE